MKRFLIILSGVAVLVVAALGLIGAYFVDKQTKELNRKRTEPARAARHANNGKADETDIDKETIELLNTQSDEQKND